MNSFAFRFVLGLVAGVFGFHAAAAEAPANSGPTNVAARAFTVVTLGNPRSIAVDRSGNLYVGDVDSGVVHKLSPKGEATPLTDGQVVRNPTGLAVDANGNVFVADADNNTIYKIAPSTTISPLGQPAAGEPPLNTPTGVAIDREGNVAISDNGGAAIRRIARDDTLTTFAGKVGETGSSDGTRIQARFNRPRGIASDGEGNLYIADEGDHTIRKISRAGDVSTLAGQPGSSGYADGSGKTARFAAPRGLAVDPAGNVFVLDTDNHVIRKITPAGAVSTLAGSPGEPGLTDGPGNTARFSEPRGIAVDAQGNVFVADTGNGVVRRIAPDGMVTTVAGPTKR